MIGSRPADERFPIHAGRPASRAERDKSIALLSQLALSSVDLAPLAQIAADVIVVGLAADLAQVFLRQDGAGSPVLLAAAGGPDTRLPSEPGALVAAVLDTGPLLARSDAGDDLSTAARALGARQGLALSLASRGQRLGAVEVVFVEPRPPSSDDEPFLQAVVSILGAACSERATLAALRLRDRALERIDQAILITDATKQSNPLIYVNAGFERMTGYRAAEVIGRNCSLLQGEGSDPETIVAMRTAIRERAVYRGQVLNYRKDGTSFWNELTISPVPDERGAVTHFVGVASDVSSRLQLEAELRRAQKMEAVGHLTGGVAHDFNNLLTVIVGAADILAEAAPEGSQLAPVVNLITTAAARGADLTRRLLAFGRRQNLAPAPTDVAEVVSHMAGLLHRTIGEEVTLSCDLAADLPPALVDRTMLETAILNLVVNARDALPLGGTVTISAARAAIGEDAATEELAAGDYVAIGVSDNGVGMTPEVLARVFEPFFTTKEPGKGTGLGLPMVFGFVKQSGGDIRIASDVGQGTRVDLLLPVAHEPARPAVAENAAGRVPTAGGKPARILLVEDDPDVRAFVAGELGALGYRVTSAANGPEALSRFATEEMDLLFTDVVLPGGLSGLALAETMQASRPALRVVFTSGYSEDVLERHTRLPRDLRLLRKPYRRQELATTLRQAFEAPPDSVAPGSIAWDV